MSAPSSNQRSEYKSHTVVTKSVTKKVTKTISILKMLEIHSKLPVPSMYDRASITVAYLPDTNSVQIVEGEPEKGQEVVTFVKVPTKDSGVDMWELLLEL